MAAHSDPHKAQRAEKAERQASAFELLKAGATYRQIGQALGVSHETARKDIEAVFADLRKTAMTGAEEYRAMELARLDALQIALWQRASKQTGPDYGAIDRVLKIMERRARLLGLDAPTKQEVKDTSDPVDWSKVPDDIRQAFLQGKVNIDVVRSFK